MFATIVLSFILQVKHGYIETLVSVEIWFNRVRINRVKPVVV